MYAVFIGRAVQTVTPPANINIQLADGTAAAPSLNFANDTNTGIFRPTTDEIALTEGGVEGMRLNASGNVQFAKNISIGGATPTTSGFGITFPGTQSASTNANTLDDYEEGIWSVDVKGGTTAGTRSLLSAFASYTKIGRQVTCNFLVRWESGTGTGDLIVTGLPFASRNESGYYYAGSIGAFDRIDFTAGNIPSMYLLHNSTEIKIQQLVDNNATIAIPYDAGDAGMIGNITYFV
jgi:hypothetical protein